MTRTSFDPDAILERLAAGGSVCGDLGLRIDRNGRWFHQGGRIDRRPLVELFAQVLHRAADGSHWLITPAEQGRIEVEDAPFLAVELAASGEGRGQRLAFRTNLDRWVTASTSHPLRCRRAPSGGVAPYLDVGRGLEARLVQPVYYALAELAVDGPEGAGPGVWSDGVFFALDGPAA